MSETIKANGVEITVDVTKKPEQSEHSGRELYKMLDDVCSMDCEDLIEEFGVEYFGDIFCEYSYDGFVKVYEQYKKHEAEIRVGDEVEWEYKIYSYSPYTKQESVARGVVVETNATDIRVLACGSTSKHHYITTIQKSEPSLRKTGLRFYMLARLIGSKAVE